MNLKLLLLILGSRLAFADVAGDWEGVLDFPAGKLRFVLHMAGADKALSAKADSPDQDAFNLAVDSLSCKDDFLRFRMVAQGVVFGGEIDDDRIRGTFSQNGLDIPVILTRIRKLRGVNLPPALTGDWSGVLNTPRGLFRLVVHLGAGTSSADSPDEHVDGMPLNSISVEGEKIEFAIKTVYASFEGTILAREIRGTFHQGGYGLPLVLKPISGRSLP